MPQPTDKFWYTSSSGTIEFQLTWEQANKGHHQGQCDPDIAELRAEDHEIIKTLSELDPEDLRKELREYGAWSDEELADHEENLSRILWIACGDIVEENWDKE